MFEKELFKKRLLRFSEKWESIVLAIPCIQLKRVRFK